MRTRYLVVDQNYLRTDELRRVLLAQQNVCLVLPDLAMLEMVKSSNRELTVRLSLEILSNQASRVYVSKASGESLKYELSSGRTVSGHMISADATKFLRKALGAVADGSKNDELARIIDDPSGHLGRLKLDYLDHAANKARSLQLVDETKGDMTREFARSVRSARATSEDLLEFVAEKAPSLLVGVLEENGFSRQRAMVFARRRPMLLRYFYLKIWACLAWETGGRLESMGSAKVSNDLLDHEYILAASFFDGILSNERYVNEGYAAMKSLLARRI